ncbi:MAG: hypothetical protein SPE19_04805 [Candidatus Faecousia sp.]|nr:hypothetical protein [Candidatus Faecousia sp.]
MSADTWYAISLAGYFAALIGLIITVILYFRLDILDVIGDLTGRTVAKEIKSMRENRSSGTARRSVRPKPPRTGKTAKTSRKTLGNSRATSGPGRSRRGTAGLTATGGSQPDKRVLHSRTDRLPQELEEQYGSFDPRVEYSRTDILPQTPEKPEAPAAEQRKRGTAILEESAGGTEQRQRGTAILEESRGTAVLEESGGGTALLQEPSKGTALLQEPGGGTTLLTGEEPTLPVKFSVTRSWLVVHTEERIEETE